MFLLGCETATCCFRLRCLTRRTRQKRTGTYWVRRILSKIGNTKKYNYLSFPVLSLHDGSVLFRTLRWPLSLRTHGGLVLMETNGGSERNVKSVLVLFDVERKKEIRLFFKIIFKN